MTVLHISTAFDAGAIEVVSLADPADIRLNIRKASDTPTLAEFQLFGP